MSDRSERDGIGKIDWSSSSTMLLLATGEVIRLMADCNLAITVESSLGLYFLRPAQLPARADFAPIGVSGEAVCKACSDGLIAAATDENDETVYLLTADGRRWINRHHKAVRLSAPAAILTENLAATASPPVRGRGVLPARQRLHRAEQ